MKKNEAVSKKKEVVRGYANLLCDFMFKRVFGSEANKDMLIEFLNMVLEDIMIEHVTFIIEMQNGFQRHFRKRAVYYTTYPINEQGRDARDRYFTEKSEGKTDAKFNWDYNLKPVIVVAILNFMFDHSADWPLERYRSSYRLREDITGEEMTDVLRFVFIELKRFRKRVWELETMYDKWIWLLGHMHELESIPENFTEPLFKRLFLLSELGKFTAVEYEQYIKSLETMGDYDNIIHTAAEDAHAGGLAEGLAMGREEGSQAKAIEIAVKLVANGMSREDAAVFVGISPDDII